MKIFNLILTAIFALFAFWQINDPDPEFWVTLYIAVALISGFAAFGKYNLWIILAAIAVCAYELFRLFPAFSTWIYDDMPSITQSMQADSPHVELVREFLGLFLSLIVMGYHYVRYRMIRFKENTS